MFNKNFSKRDKITLISLLLVLLTATAIIVGMVAAKYIQEKRTPGKIKVSVEVADDIKVYEHEAGRTPDGDYTLGENTTDNNKYTLMPGVDIPKDPTIRIIQYTGLKSWLYVEVTGTAPDTVTFQLADGWAELKDNGVQVLGPNEGKVYYREFKAAEGAEYPTDVDVPVLKAQDTAGNTLIVSQNVARDTSFTLGFTAYIAQQTDTALNTAPANPGEGN